MLSSRLNSIVESLGSRISNRITQEGSFANAAAVRVSENTGAAVSQLIESNSGGINLLSVQGNGPSVSEQIIRNESGDMPDSGINIAIFSDDGQIPDISGILDDIGVDLEPMMGQEAVVISRGRSWSNSATQILGHVDGQADSERSKNATFANGVDREVQEIRDFVGTDRLNTIQIDGSSGVDYVKNQSLDKKLFTVVTEEGEQVITGQDLVDNGRLYPNGVFGGSQPVNRNTLTANSIQDSDLNNFHTGYQGDSRYTSEIGGLVMNFFAKNPNGFIMYTDPSTGYRYRITAGATSWTPLVIDLDGDGFNFTRMPDTQYYDPTSGEMKTTAWNADTDDAFVVQKINDEYHLFGPQTAGLEGDNGFTHLAQFDDNGDGQVDAQEATRHNIFLWRDNGNAQVAAEEILSFDDVHLAHISVGYRTQDNWVDSNAAPFIGQAQFANGQIASVIDVLFNER